MTEDNSSIPGYIPRKVGDINILVAEDDRPTVFQKVTPKEQYAVAKDVANRAIDEINALRGRRPSSFSEGINAANIAARRQANETYGRTLPGGEDYEGARQAAFDQADAYKRVLDDHVATRTATPMARITGDWGYGPSIRYPVQGQEIIDDPVIDDPVIDDPVIDDPILVEENPWYRESRGTQGNFNAALRSNEGWSGTHWDSPRDDGDIYDTGSFSRTNYLSDQFKNAAGDDNILSYDEYVTGILSRPDKYAYNPDTSSNALANYWATTGATIDPKALRERDLFMQDGNLVQRLGTGDAGPNLALNDYVKFLRREDDGDDEYFTYYQWSPMAEKKTL